MKLPVLKTTETNREAADDMTMIMLKEWCGVNRPELSGLFVLVQEYRKWGKIKSTYIDGYLKFLNSVTGCIHPDLFALSTDTGRMNCRNPNAQNMPRKTNDPIGVRNFIRAPEGHLILSLDFSQIELRVGAFYCRDEVMMDTYRKNGGIHAATTSVIFGVSYEEAQDKHSENYKEHRMIAKNVNFGTFYAEVKEMVESIGLESAYHHFAEGESPDPPFIVFLYPNADNFAADGIVYFTVNVLHIELYTDKKDLDLEEQVETVLTEYGIYYNKSEVWIESERLYEVLYEED